MELNFRRLALFVLPIFALLGIIFHLHSRLRPVELDSPSLAPGTDSGEHDESSPALDESSPADNDGPIRNYLISSDFNFTDRKPDWLLSPPPRPLVLRIGIISHPKDFERRRAFRETTLRGVPKNEVIIHHRFLVGYSGEGDEDRRVLEEYLEHGDIIRLDMRESKLRIGEKRWRMLKWVSEAHRSTYDYYLSADTDAFFRLGALARRLPYIRPDLNSPQTQDIYLGRMVSHKMHFKANPYDNETTFDKEDDQFQPGEFPGEEWYPYAYGYGVLLSSHLVDRLASPEISLPHHVHYPADDVLIGQWVADYAPGTIVVGDYSGFHDAVKHGWGQEHNKVVDYDSVCVHHLSPSEMRQIRNREEFAGEWEEYDVP